MSEHDQLKPLTPPAQKQQTSCCSSTDCHEPLVAPNVILNKTEPHQDHHADACCSPEPSNVTETTLTLVDIPVDANSVRYRIDNMDCPTEERLIRNKLEAMTGIKRLDFNLLDRELTVYHQLDDDLSITKALKAIDMAPLRLEVGTSAAPALPTLDGKKKILLAVSGVAAVAAEMMAWQSGQDMSWVVLALTTVSILSAGLPTLKKGWIALSNLTLNIYFLMSLAVTGALVIGKWPEAAMVIFLFAIAEAIEALSLERARHAIKSLTDLAPETAIMQDGDIWHEMPVGKVAVGSLIRIRTGERVPLDARVVSGSASLDQAPITGESLPVDKQIGDVLFAGSIVTDGVIEAIVTATAGESTLARIAKAIQEAQSQRAPTQRFVDQFAHYYTPAVVALAAGVAILGPLFMGGTWSNWLYEALVLLVIACPCALVISTPITVVSGLAAAARHGILIKGGVHLEGGRLLKVIALDKTGTLTQGKPILTDVISIADITSDEALLIAASLDDNSTHPIAKALVLGWKTAQPTAKLFAVEAFAVLNGRGVKGNINGQDWHLGNHRLVEGLGLCSAELEARLVALEHQGKTVIILCNSVQPIAIFAVADTIRPESIEAIAKLKALHVLPVMLTGDNLVTAQSIAEQLGIHDGRGNLLPEEKQAAIADLNTLHGAIGMVGDGVNDAPALARANIGFAMGAAGTATALETADVAIMDDDPRKVADFITLSHRTATVLKQNITLAFGIKVVFLGLALSGHATLWMAVFADMGASLLVVFNGLRLLRIRFNL